MRRKHLIEDQIQRMILSPAIPRHRKRRRASSHKLGAFPKPLWPRLMACAGTWADAARARTPGNRFAAP